MSHLFQIQKQDLMSFPNSMDAIDSIVKDTLQQDNKTEGPNIKDIYVLHPLMVVMGGRRYTAKEQPDTSPQCGILDARPLVASSFRPPSNIQLLLFM